MSTSANTRSGAMDTDARRYFKLAGKSLDGFLAMHKRRDDIWDARRALLKELGCKEYIISGDSVDGVVFKDAPDEKAWTPGIVQVGGKSVEYYYPNRRTKAGKAMRDRLDDLRDVSGWDVNRALGVRVPIVGNSHGRGCIMRYCVPQKIGKTWYASVPADASPPPDAIAIKASQWHRLLEKAEARP